MQTLVFLYELSIAFGIGMLVHFLLVDASLARRVLQPEQAARYVQQASVVSCLYALVLGLVSLLLNFVLMLTAAFGAADLLVAAILLGLMILLTVYVRFVLLPQTNVVLEDSLCSAGGAPHPRVPALQRVATVINGLVVLLGVVVLWLAVGRLHVA